MKKPVDHILWPSLPWRSWEPTPEELARLNAGAKVSLLVLGTVHPPVSVSVGMPPKEGE